MRTSPFPWSEGESFVFDASGQAICREYSHNLNWKDDRALIAAIPEMVAALENLQQRAGAVATWLNHWDVPFADQDEWRGPTGDGQLFFNALNEAAAVLKKVKP